MARVARDGVDVDQLVELLVKNTSAGRPSNPSDVRDILKVLVEAERCAVRGYTRIAI